MGLQLFSQNHLPYYPIKPFNVGTQKNHLNETIILSTHNIGLEGQIRILEHAKRPLSRTYKPFPVYKKSSADNFEKSRQK